MGGDPVERCRSEAPCSFIILNRLSIRAIVYSRRVVCCDLAQKMNEEMYSSGDMSPAARS